MTQYAKTYQIPLVFTVLVIKDIIDPIYYVTTHGQIFGKLMISPYFITFEPNDDEGYALIDLTGEVVIEYQCFIDVSDIIDCISISLPNQKAIQENSRVKKFDHYLQLLLVRTKGKAFYDDAEEAIIHFKVLYYTN